MSTPYSTTYTPPVPILEIRLAAPGESPRVGPFSAIVDTGSDGTLVPTQHLERLEAIDIGDAVLYGALGEARRVHLYEVDVWVVQFILPGVVVVGDDHGDEVVLGRNTLNRLIILLDGLRHETELFEQRPRGH